MEKLSFEGASRLKCRNISWNHNLAGRSKNVGIILRACDSVTSAMRKVVVSSLSHSSASWSGLPEYLGVSSKVFESNVETVFSAMTDSSGRERIGVKDCVSEELISMSANRCNSASISRAAP